MLFILKWEEINSKLFIEELTSALGGIKTISTPFSKTVEKPSKYKFHSFYILTEHTSSSNSLKNE